MIGQDTANEFFLADEPATIRNTAYGEIHLLVNRASTVLVVDASLYSNGSRCQVVAQVTPSS